MIFREIKANENFVIFTEIQCYICMRYVALNWKKYFSWNERVTTFISTFHEYFAHFIDKGVVAQGKFGIIISYFFAAVVTRVYSKFVQFHEKNSNKFTLHTVEISQKRSHAANFPWNHFLLFSYFLLWKWCFFRYLG